MPLNETKNAPTKLNETPPKDASDFEVQQRDPKRNSVYDFLYHDARRIASFLSQFQTYGFEQNIKTSESVGQATSHKTAMQAAGGVPLVAHGQAGLDQTTATEEKDAAERTYDPLWRNALILLDYLDEAGLIHRDILSSGIGQFVLASGNLTVLNAAMMRETWVTPVLRAAVIKQATDNAKTQWNANAANAALTGHARKTAERRALEAAKLNAEVNIDNLKHYPHTISCIIRESRFSIWAPLHEEGITGAASDISLMHGSDVPGSWNLLGILDARPSPIPAQIPVPPSPVPTHFAPSITNFANMGRMLLGRPPDAYGMTALLLFREVTP